MSALCTSSLLTSLPSSLATTAVAASAAISLTRADRRQTKPTDLIVAVDVATGDIERDLGFRVEDSWQCFSQTSQVVAVANSTFKTDVE